MNIAKYKNDNNMFPVTTETFDFIQNQILLLQELSKTFGENYLIQKPTAEQSGAIVINNELFEFKFSEPKEYVEISTANVKIDFKDHEFDDFVEERVCRYCDKKENNTNCYKLKFFTDIKQTIKKLETFTRDLEESTDILDEKTEYLLDNLEKRPLFDIEYFMLDKKPEDLNFDNMMCHQGQDSNSLVVPCGYIPCFGFGSYQWKVYKSDDSLYKIKKDIKSSTDSSTEQTEFEKEAEKWENLIKTYTNCTKIVAEEGVPTLKNKKTENDYTGGNAELLLRHSIQIKNCNDIAIPDLSGNIIHTTKMRKAIQEGLSTTYDANEEVIESYLYPFIRCFYE